jgi:uncharacterized protein (DUF305 family)
MQGMIVHHAQAVEMTSLIALRTKNPEIIKLGEKISQSQADEMSFMRLWLEIRNAPVEPADGKGMKHNHGGKHGLMPGMLSFERMEELREATGAEFDRLFLVGMIEHHEGALWMVRDLFSSAGAGQDAELFNFATDVDSGQRAEIKVMQMLLEKSGLTEKK